MGIAGNEMIPFLFPPFQWTSPLRYNAFTPKKSPVMSNSPQVPWESLRAFAEGAFDGIAILDEEGRIQEWNSQASELFGWRRNEALGQPLQELIAPQSEREAFRESFIQIQHEDRLSQTGTLFQVVGQHKTGSRVMVGISIVPICIQPQPLYAAYIRDVSQESPLVPQIKPETTTIQLLYQTTMASATALSFEEALGRSIERICELTGWTIGHAWLPDPTGELLTSSEICAHRRRHADRCAPGRGGRFPAPAGRGISRPDLGEAKAVLDRGHLHRSDVFRGGFSGRAQRLGCVRVSGVRSKPARVGAGVLLSPRRRALAAFAAVAQHLGQAVGRHF